DLDELRTIASALSNLIGIPTTPRGTYTTSEISQAELHWGIRRALQILAREKPTAVIVEDLHWAEPTLLELISYVLGEEADVPLPTTVQGLISSRLDRLDTKQKQLAHHASVIGAIFWAGAVAHLGAREGAAPEDPRPSLIELERRDFVAHLKESTVADDEEY